ncbi:WxL domain-containing protein [Enterococcus sp. 4E1_DIV0656]|uniref:WxL domain-containing protein n=1 Tax=Enterococcus sp. 4E1_DIV0656 TaxID=1834180 RepID=UPI0020CF501B|nr:WxL domain-containing protein [Enterococcus sp. 4E1_DIV0656]
MNQAQVTISRGNATVLFSSATVADPKITVEQGATVTITTTAGVANTIDLRGENPEVFLQSGELDVATVGTTAAPTETTNNTIALRGTTPKITMNSNAQLTVRSTLAKRGIHLSGDNAQLLVNNSELSVTSATQATINLTGDHSSFSSENSTIQLVSTTGVTTNITGESPQLIFDSSKVSFTSSSGQRINLVGNAPLVSLSSTEMTMNATTGRGVYLQGATPQVLMESSRLLMTDTGASQGMILQGTDALLSLSNQSEFILTAGGSGIVENILIGGANNPRPELLVTDRSKLSVTTSSGISPTTGDAASNITNNAINVRGAESKTTISNGSELNILVTSNGRRGLTSEGAKSELLVSDSLVNISTVDGHSIFTNNDDQKVLIRGSQTRVDLNAISGAAYQHWTGNNEFIITDSATVNATSSGGRVFSINGSTGVLRDQYMEISNNATVNILRDSESYASSSALFHSTRQFTLNIDSGHLDIKDEKGPSDSALQVGASEGSYSTISNGGSIDIYTSKNDSTIITGNNSGINAFSSAEVKFTITGIGSKVRSISEDGDAFRSNSTGRSIFELSNLASLELSGRSTGGALNNINTDIIFNNPLYFDIQNVELGGRAISTTNVSSTLIGIQSGLSLWERTGSITGNPTFNFDTLDYQFTGIHLNTLLSTNKPEELNTSVIGTTGLSNFRRISSNNGRWAIADELRVPTNADAKIHGRVSLPEGLDSSRPAWDDEAIVTVEVESPSGENTQEYTAKTVGDANESPGISIYGEEPRGGLFEIDLDEPLEVGSKVRISKVELTSGELTDGFEHQILTETVEVFPIIPPTPAQFSSSIIPQDSTTIQGMTDNLDAEVTATHNGEPLNTEAVNVEADGRFTLDLSEVSLEMDDEIQVFLRDAEGSAVTAGVVNPPETNNTRGNINPSTELTFHDVTFQSATILTVGDLGPILPVDPLDPEVEVDPENRPELPEDQGLLSIDFISSFDFGSQAISVQDQTYYAKPQRLLNEDGTVNESEERPNYVQVSDRRSENDRNGWQLAVTQKEQFKNQTNQELIGARLNLSNQQLATANGGESPSLQVTNPLTLVPGNKRTLIRAEGTEGTGTWIYRFGDGETAGESVALDVPKGANPEATTYSATLLWELSAVPGN